jgi:RNA recognition motif-containing protein
MNIYVGNLSLEVTEDDLRREFVIFGKVTSVILMSDTNIGSGQGRGFGYVEMPSLKEGESAVYELQGKSIKGRQLDVIKALPVTRICHNELDSDMKVQGFSRKNRYWGGRKRRE